jgi:hypothetical protein
VGRNWAVCRAVINRRPPASARRCLEATPGDVGMRSLRRPASVWYPPARFSPSPPSSARPQRVVRLTALGRQSGMLQPPIETPPSQSPHQQQDAGVGVKHLPLSSSSAPTRMDDAPLSLVRRSGGRAPTRRPERLWPATWRGEGRRHEMRRMPTP